MPQGEYLQYGGQAIIEGVMMRSPRFFSVACRAPNGEIVLQTEAIEKTWIGRQNWLKKPFLRGSLALLDAMALGIRAMRFAANVQMADEYQDPNAEAPEVKEPKPFAVRVTVGLVEVVVGLALVAAGMNQIPSVPLTSPFTKVALALGVVLTFIGGSGLANVFRKPTEDMHQAPQGKIQDVAIGATMIVSLAFGMFLFNYVPNLVAEFAARAFSTKDDRLINLTSEIVKIVIFLGYIGLIGLMPDVRRVFQYHGAEHKAINTLEAEQELTLENCKAQTRLHPRCGTSFAMIVLLLGLLTFTFVPRYPVTGQQGNPFVDVTVRFLIELAILPIIAGVAYELLRIAGKFRNQTIVNLAFKPGIWSQYLTTREPDEEQIQVALDSLKACIDAENEVPGRPSDPVVIESAPTVVG
ncbi:MAG: DUF1385 domain-containing protein [Fimbriimonas sp.]